MREIATGMNVARFYKLQFVRAAVDGIIPASELDARLRDAVGQKSMRVVVAVEEIVGADQECRPADSRGSICRIADRPAAVKPMCQPFFSGERQNQLRPVGVGDEID